MNRKLVIIQNCHTQQRVIKRTKEFIDSGIDAEVYGFRWAGSFEPSLPYPITILGTFEERSFLKRFMVLAMSMLRIKREHPKDENVLFYVFSLDVTMMFHFIYPSAEYIYEESDLTHTYLGSSLARSFFESVDKRLIKNAFKAVFTSEGFIRYHFGNETHNNAVLIPNKLDRRVLNLQQSPQRPVDENHLVLGFVGVPRFKAVRDFIRTFCTRFPQHEFHVFGGPIKQNVEEFNAFNSFSNYFYHGAFKSPDDLPAIYGGLNAVLSTYDTEYINVRYAEPNKLYEAVFFETPIIVSKGTFLAEKVEELGIGFTVDATNEEDVVKLIHEMSAEVLTRTSDKCHSISKSHVIDDNSTFVRDVHDYLIT